MFFTLRKILVKLLFPLPLAAWLLVIGLVLLLRKRRPRTARGFLAAGLVVMYVGCCQLTSRLLMYPLETRYAPCLDPAAQLHAGSGSDERPAAPWIVVLGTGFNPDERLSPVSRVSPVFLARLLEGVRIHRCLRGSRLLVSIPGRASSEEKHDFVDAVCGMIGIDPTRVPLLELARDTRDEARAAKLRVGDAPLFLVTDAVHMPRAVYVFRHTGLFPIPVPVGQAAKCGLFSHFEAAWLFPSSGGLGGSERAIYEYLGLLRECLR